MKALLIAEKPSLMRDIKAVYQKMSFKDDITFMALAGHVLELQEPQDYEKEWGQPWKMEVLPMIPEKFVYKPTQRTRQLFNDAKKAIMSGAYDYVINACDAGREGELIFYSLYKTVGKKIPVKRFWSTNTTDVAVEKALNNLIDDKDPTLTNLKASAQYRAYFDWLMGMNYTRAITLSSHTTIPVGRVMTPTLALIVNRELEITNFKPETFYELVADFADKYSGTWTDLEENTSRIILRKDAEDIISKSGNLGVVESVVAKENSRKAPTLHSLTELQKDCNKMFGYTLDKTLSIAQELYEKKKLITYPRTESRYLPKDMVKEIPSHVKCLQSIKEVSTHVGAILADKAQMDKVLASKDYVNDSKVTDHHAIIPTAIFPKVESLTKEEYNVYLLIVKRFLAIFMKPLVVENTTVITDASGQKYKTTGKVIIDPGYTVLFNSSMKDVILPSLKKGDKFDIPEIHIIEKQTTPPNRYNDASLVTAMQTAGKEMTDSELRKVMKETAGLGTVATRSGIVEKLIAKKFIERKGKIISATDDGVSVIRALKGKDIVSPALTAEWETKLKQIEDGKLEPKVFYSEMIAYIKSETEGFKTIKATLSKEGLKPVGKCPICNADVVVAKKFYICSNYSKEADGCAFVFGKTIATAKVGEIEAKKILNGKESKELTFKGKNGEFKTSLHLKDNKVTFAFKNNSTSNSKGEQSKDIARKEVEFLKENASGENLGKCPKCSSKVVEGNEFYLCTNYGEKCDFNLKKEIKGGLITPKNIKIMLEGKTTEPITFIWANKNEGTARLSYSKKLNWHFNK